LEQQGDPVEFLGWLLNKLHKDMGGSKKKNSSIIFSTFQGELRVETQQVLVRPDAGENERPLFDIDRDIKSNVSPFLFLAVDLPPPPLFQDSIEKNIIPQVNIVSVLSKYDGVTTQESAGQLRRFKCQRLPPYIILHFKRFTKNAFVEEKNPTIVNFPLRGLNFQECMSNVHFIPSLLLLSYQSPSNHNSYNSSRRATYPSLHAVRPNSKRNARVRSGHHGR
jgi:U4/U6.U5 tri-snRNP-associated protein 2